MLNANTLEQANEQYLSMVQEKTVAGPSPHDPELPNVVPSAEATPYWAFPGLRPRRLIGDLEYGALRTSG